MTNSHLGVLGASAVSTQGKPFQPDLSSPGRAGVLAVGCTISPLESVLRITKHAHLALGKKEMTCPPR